MGDALNCGEWTVHWLRTTFPTIEPMLSATQSQRDFLEESFAALIGAAPVSYSTIVPSAVPKVAGVSCRLGYRSAGARGVSQPWAVYLCSRERSYRRGPFAGASTGRSGWHCEHSLSRRLYGCQSSSSCDSTISELPTDADGQQKRQPFPIAKAR